MARPQIDCACILTSACRDVQLSSVLRVISGLPLFVFQILVFLPGAPGFGFWFLIFRLTPIPSPSMISAYLAGLSKEGLS